MKQNKLMIAIVALILVVVFFSAKTWIRQDDNRPSSAVGGDSVLENAPSEKLEASAQPLKVGDDKKDEAATATVPPDKSRIKMTLPKPFFKGTPAEIQGAFNLEAPRGGKSREPIIVPDGCDSLLSRDCKVTSSDPESVFGELSFITDGDKEWDAFVEISPHVQWVQIDLGREREIFAICVWHCHKEPRVYRDVVWQISNDPEFTDGVVTVFNNDHDNSAKLGVGKDKEYIETYEGRPLPVNAVKGRYVRCYSRGNTTNAMNHYTEIEVYGKRI